MTSKRRGRPPSPPETARSHRVVTFVTPVELTKLQQISESRNQALSATVHQMIADKLQTQLFSTGEK
jgi:hypothetical protein